MRVWFSPDDIIYTLLSPDNQISSVPYALQAQEAVDADTVDGFHASQLGANYQNIIIVAKSGGDYTSIQAAIDSISDASESNPYLVWIAPGVYEEAILLKSDVHLEGAGQDATVITSSLSNSSLPPTQATVYMTSYSSLRDLTIENTGTGLHNVALYNASHAVLVENTTIRAKGAGASNYAIYLNDYETILRHVTANSFNASDTNYGLLNTHWSYAHLDGGRYEAIGGATTYGIYSSDDVTTLDAYNSTVIGRDGTGSNYGLYNDFASKTNLFGGIYTGRGGTTAIGIHDNFQVIAENVIALGESASGVNIGLLSTGMTEINGGSFTGKEGSSAYGISVDNGHMNGYSIKSYAELGDNNYGLSLQNESVVSLYSGSFTANGGDYAYGVYNSLDIGTFETRGSAFLAEGALTANYGLYNDNTHASHIVGGSFTALQGVDNYGIFNTGVSGNIEAQGLYIRGEFGSGINYGIYDTDEAQTFCDYCVVDGLTP